MTFSNAPQARRLHLSAGSSALVRVSLLPDGYWKIGIYFNEASIIDRLPVRLRGWAFRQGIYRDTGWRCAWSLVIEHESKQ
jgi:hypothetical protein